MGAAEHELAVPLRGGRRVQCPARSARARSARHRVPRQQRKRGRRPRAAAGDDRDGKADRPRDARGLSRLDCRIRCRLVVDRRQPARARDPPRLGAARRRAEHFPRHASRSRTPARGTSPTSTRSSRRSTPTASPSRASSPRPSTATRAACCCPTATWPGVYARIRERGGLCIADEVQVGYGRLGEHFWGFEQQGVVPDVITIAKAMGNGHPLGAVITTRAIADAFAAEGSMFSSAGGSPVSCVAGMAVLDILEDEGLQENARVVGGCAPSRPRGARDPARTDRRRPWPGPLPRRRARALARHARAGHLRGGGDLRRASPRGRHHAADRRSQERAEDQAADAAHPARAPSSSSRRWTGCSPHPENSKYKILDIMFVSVYLAYRNAYQGSSE